MKHLPATFYVRTPTPELFKMVQDRFFNLGIFWDRDKENGESRWQFYTEETCISFNYNDDNFLGHCHRPFYVKENITEISIADLFILSPEPKKKTLEIKGAPWKIEIGPEIVSVGCCSFKKEKLKETLGKIWNLSPKERKETLFYDFPIKTTDSGNTISFYEGRQGLDVWINQKFEHTVPWNAVEELIAALEKY
jgi:hypothetical protein